MADRSSNEIEIRVRATDQTRPGFAATRKAVRGVTDAVGELDAEMAATRAEIKRTEAELAALAKARPTAEIDADTRVASTKIAAVEENLEELRKKPVTAKVTAQIAAAERNLLKLQAELDRLNGEKAATINVRADTAAAKARLAELNGHLDELGRRSKAGFGEADRAAGMLTSALGGVLKAGAGLAALNSGVAAIGGLAAAAATAAGAALVLPAALGAVTLATSTVKVGMQGFGDAMSAVAEGDAAAFEEAVGKLAPQAQETARAVRGLKPAWDSLQLDVQNKLFSETGSRLAELGTTYLPILRTAMGGVAESFNSAAHDALDFFAMEGTPGRMAGMFDNMREAIGEVATAFGPLVEAMFNIGEAGASFLPGLVAGAGDAAQSFAEWTRNSEQLHSIISGGLSALGDLGKIAGNVGSAVAGIFTAADVSGGGFLNNLIQITGQLSEMVNSAAGQEALGTFFATTSQLAGLFTQALQALLPVLPSIVTLLSQMALGAGTALVGALTALAPLIQQVATFFTQYPGLMGAVGTALVVLVGAFQGFSAISGIVTTVGAVFGSTLGQMAIKAMVSAASMAASWIVAMGPVGWVIAAVVGLVALIVANWDTVKAWTEAAWSAVSSAISTAWNTVVGFVQAGIERVKGIINWFAQLPGMIGGWFGGAVSAVSGKIGELISWVAGIPGRVLSALGNIGSMLINSGRSLVDGFLNGIKGAWNGLVSWVKSGMDRLRGLWPFSPAKEGPFSGSGYVTHSGKALTDDFAASIRGGQSTVAQAARAVMGAAQGGLTGPITAAGVDPLTGQSLASGGGVHGVLPTAVGSGGGTGQPVALELLVAPGSDGAVATLIQRLVREGKIQIRASQLVG